MKFSDFGQIGKSKTTSPGVPVEGTFGCQLCDHSVTEAYIHMSESLLVWTCPDGHVSSMEWKA